MGNQNEKEIKTKMGIINVTRAYPPWTMTPLIIRTSML